ncbi:hypothetical protein [Sulfuracidifex tepidarius]|uniref:hypothetical protein n=1 Tax=Sulfuracidifex tepidarius TaxID=1294262 RepID=UPI0011F3523A|nr:hypothetical protein [Sulfuracidifex tepidarius]
MSRNTPDLARNTHEGVPLVFDLPLKGFYRWSRRRVIYLGFRPFVTPYRYDHQIMLYAELIRGYIVTTDKGFPCWRAVVLDVDKYEKMYVRMLKGLHKLKEKRPETSQPY